MKDKYEHEEDFTEPRRDDDEDDLFRQDCLERARDMQDYCR